MVDRCVVCGEVVPEGLQCCLHHQKNELEDALIKSHVSNIKDSGQRREFETGAVRDMAPKGRCDLLPWSIIKLSGGLDNMLFCESMEDAVHHRQIEESIKYCINAFVPMAFSNYPSALLEVAFHYEDGCKKYGERNWEKAIPVDSFLDSAGRHYLKWCRGDKDERHDRAVVWNLLCALWTCKHKPEMIGGDPA